MVETAAVATRPAAAANGGEAVENTLLGAAAARAAEAAAVRQPDGVAIVWVATAFWKSSAAVASPAVWAQAKHHHLCHGTTFAAASASESRPAQPWPLAQYSSWASGP